MATTTTHRSTPQAASALLAANRARVDAAALKRELRKGELTLADALEDPRAARLRVPQVVLLVRYVGRLRMIAALDAVGCSEFKRCGELTARQRAIIVERIAR